MKKIFILLLIAFTASMISFVIHVVSEEWIFSFVSIIMEGKEVAPSWDVRYIAALSAVEIGIAQLIIYILIRKVIPIKSSVIKGIILGTLLLMINGSLLRQPLMNYLIGNPLKVILIQDGITWIIWLLSSVFTAVSYEFFLSRFLKGTYKD